jgi:hypothetical protein
VFLRSGVHGQVLAEFAFFSLVAAVVVGEAGLLIQAEWYRSQCAYLTFEATHARLTGRHGVRSHFDIQIVETADRIQGVGHCGNAVEKVELPVLETARW